MSFLSEILDRKRVEVEERRAKESEEVLLRRAEGRAAPRSLYAALSPPGGPTCIIAEVKRASPSVGNIDARVDAPGLARRYASAGAAAISVLTDGPGFGGSLEDLRAVRAAVTVPLLRKDFILDRYQLLEALAAGADVVLLIVAALEQSQLVQLQEQAQSLGLEALVEVHDEEELARAVDAGARLIGVNNRNLATFHVDLATSERLIPRIPASARAVAESGVREVEHAARLRRAGVVNLLVGEALVRASSGASSEALLRAFLEAR